MESKSKNLVLGFVVLAVFLISGVKSWTGEIHGRVVCDVCADSSIGPEDHILEGAEVAVLCITKSGEVVNYQAFTNAKGIYTVAKQCLRVTVGIHAWHDRSVVSMNTATIFGIAAPVSSSPIVAHQVISTLSDRLYINPLLPHPTAPKLLVNKYTLEAIMDVLTQMQARMF